MDVVVWALKLARRLQALAAGEYVILFHKPANDEPSWQVVEVGKLKIERP